MMNIKYFISNDPNSRAELDTLEYRMLMAG